MRIERTFAWEDKFKRRRLRFEHIQQRHYGMKLLAYTLELVASFVKCSNLLKSWEKTDTGEVSASGAYGPKNAAITRIPAPYSATESHHFSDGTALACSCGHTPWLMREASALLKTRNQYKG